jgi:hypothetical protein
MHAVRGSAYALRRSVSHAHRHEAIRRLTARGSLLITPLSRVSTALRNAASSSTVHASTGRPAHRYPRRSSSVTRMNSSTGAACLEIELALLLPEPAVEGEAASATYLTEQGR